MIYISIKHNIIIVCSIHSLQRFDLYKMLINCKSYLKKNQETSVRYLPYMYVIQIQTIKTRRNGFFL